MEMDYFSFGSIPSGEEDFLIVNFSQDKRNCESFLKQILKHYPAPEGCKLEVKYFPDESYPCHEVVGHYDIEDDAAIEWVYDIAEDIKGVLSTWDEEFRPDHSSIS